MIPRRFPPQEENISKSLDKPDEYKFLGKEVAYYDGIFRLWLSIMNKIAKGEDVTNLVNHLEMSFPYQDKKYKADILKAQSTLEKNGNVKNKYGQVDSAKSRKAISEFTTRKYQLIMELFKRKKVLPQEAEEEWL